MSEESTPYKSDTVDKSYICPPRYRHADCCGTCKHFIEHKKHPPRVYFGGKTVIRESRSDQPFTHLCEKVRGWIDIRHICDLYEKKEVNHD